MSTLTRATSRIETKLLTECDEAESFCSMLAFYLQDKAHWKSNPYALDLINQVSDLIDETRGEIEKGRNSARQDANDTAGERYGGKCRVPMWSMGGPAGFCEEVAYGPQYPSRYLHPHQVKSDRLHMPYCYGPCCPAHGGPKDGEPILFTDGTTDDGYPMWCAVMPSFINLQESPAGFSGNPIKAVESLTVALRIAADIQTGAEGRS